MSTSVRLTITKITIILASLTAILISINLWHSSRTYPLTPLIPNLALPFPVDYYFLLFVLLTFALNTWFNSQKLLIVLLVSLVSLILFDQSRLQPWLYQYWFMLFYLCRVDWQAENSKKNAVMALQLIVAGVYFWSGVSKLSNQFYIDVYPWLLNFNPSILSPYWQDFLKPFGILVPIIEITISILLLLPNLRTIGVVLVVLTHLIILLSISFLGHNSNPVIWPWNIAMPVMVLLLFSRMDSQGYFHFLRGGKGFILSLFFIILPATSYFNLWDSSLSFELYSGNVSRSTMKVDRETAKNLPPAIFRYFNTSTLVLDMNAWSDEELNIPVYKERRIYLNLLQSLCKYSTDLNGVQLTFTERQKLFFMKTQPETYYCPTRY